MARSQKRASRTSRVRMHSWQRVYRSPHCTESQGCGLKKSPAPKGRQEKVPKSERLTKQAVDHRIFRPFQGWSLANVSLGCRVEIWRGCAGPVSRSRSSNRTCSLPASGFRTKYLAYAHDKPWTRRCLRCGIQRSLHRPSRGGLSRLIQTSISLALGASALTLN